MYSGYQCANCGSVRTSAFYGDHFLVCIRCDDCSHVEYRDDRDIDTSFGESVSLHDSVADLDCP